MEMVYLRQGQILKTEESEQDEKTEESEQDEQTEESEDKQDQKI